MSLLIVAFISLINPAISQSKSAPKQPVLGVRSARILELGGLKFKDLNRNDQLDKYEAWRLSAQERSRDLLTKMSLEQKVGFMLVSTIRMKNDQSRLCRLDLLTVCSNKLSRQTRINY